MKLFTFEPTTPPAVILEARYWPLARRSYSGKKGIVDYCNVPRPVMKGALLSRSLALLSAMISQSSAIYIRRNTAMALRHF